MRFQPKTEAEVNAANLLPGGEYLFEVSEAEEQKSKAGNDMVKLKLYVFDDEERRHVIFDYLVGTESAAYKLRHFAESIGLIAQYEHGEIRAEQMITRTGKCQVGIQKDKGGQYPDKNVIRDYVIAAPAASVAKANGTRQAAHAPDLDDNIPFMYEWR